MHSAVANISQNKNGINRYYKENEKKDTQKFMLPVSDRPNVDQELYQRYVQLKRSNKEL